MTEDKMYGIKTLKINEDELNLLCYAILTACDSWKNSTLESDKRRLIPTLKVLKNMTGLDFLDRYVKAELKS